MAPASPSGGHSTVPFAGRGEAPWRELELLVESGLTPLQAITAATQTSAASLRRPRRSGHDRGRQARDLSSSARIPRATSTPSAACSG
jgi:hypothetical protein